MKNLLGVVVACLFVLYAAFHIMFSSTWSLPVAVSSAQPKPEPGKFAHHGLKKSRQLAAEEFDFKEIRCLAKNIYFEARNSTVADKAATADVVINRVRDKRYPSTICGVISQGIKPGRKDCQFSWNCDGRSDNPVDNDSWIEAKTMAYNMYVYKKYRGISKGATHYHATYVKPYWAESKRMVGQIGAHVYYKWE